MEQQDPQFNELFQQLKREDARHAPSFARVWAAAAARRADTGGHWPVWRPVWRPVLRMAVAALALLVCAGVWFAFFRRAPVERIALPVTPPVAPVPSHKPQQQSIAASTGKLVGKPVRQAKRQRRHSAPPLPLEALVSQWRSPTDFLLKTPGARWLNEVPRLGVPRLEIRAFVIEEQNELEEL